MPASERTYHCIFKNYIFWKNVFHPNPNLIVLMGSFKNVLPWNYYSETARFVGFVLPSFEFSEAILILI